ncbi:MAG: creatininase family protein [Wenzhouxiangella sp.]
MSTHPPLETTARIHEWAGLTTIELAELAAQDPLAILVLGAIEQHGPHLPLSTDLDIGQGLCRAALASLQPARSVIVLPAQAIGASDEHADFAGTLSLSGVQMVGLIEALGQSVAEAGIRRLLLLNAHGGNVAAMNMAALTLRRRFEMLVVKANYMAMAPPDGVLGVEELRCGLHGGQAETAMMLALYPEKVHRQRLADFDYGPQAQAHLGPEGEAAWAWLAQDLNAAGVVGRAAQATPEQGRLLVDHYAARLGRVIEDSLAIPWPPA